MSHLDFLNPRFTPETFEVCDMKKYNRADIGPMKVPVSLDISSIRQSHLLDLAHLLPEWEFPPDARQDIHHA